MKPLNGKVVWSWVGNRSKMIWYPQLLYYFWMLNENIYRNLVRFETNLEAFPLNLAVSTNT